MLRDDLIAAKALIDTPDKLQRGIVTAIECVCAEQKDVRAALKALRGAGMPLQVRDHGAVVAAFDRAIQAATPEPENKS